MASLVLSALPGVRFVAMSYLSLRTLLSIDDTLREHIRRHQSRVSPANGESDQESPKTIEEAIHEVPNLALWLGILRSFEDFRPPLLSHQENERKGELADREKHKSGSKSECVEGNLLKHIRQSQKAGGQDNQRQHLTDANSLGQEHCESATDQKPNPQRLKPVSCSLSNGLAIRAVASGVNPPMIARVCEASPALRAL